MPEIYHIKLLKKVSTANIYNSSTTKQCVIMKHELHCMNMCPLRLAIVCGRGASTTSEAQTR